MEPVRVRIRLRGYDGPMDALPMATDFDGRPGLPDRFGRALRDLRISVTDRCNFRCPYCMPAEVFGRDFAFLPKELVLSFEEIERLARVFVELGVGKLRITGGEPLVRRDLPVLIESLAAIRTPDGRRSISRSRRTAPRSARWPLPSQRPGCSGSRSRWIRSTTRSSGR